MSVMRPTLIRQIGEHHWLRVDAKEIGTEYHVCTDRTAKNEKWVFSKCRTGPDRVRRITKLMYLGNDNTWRLRTLTTESI